MVLEDSFIYEDGNLCQMRCSSTKTRPKLTNAYMQTISAICLKHNSDRFVRSKTVGG